jgi:hypothetical protein
MLTEMQLFEDLNFVGRLFKQENKQSRARHSFVHNF